MTGSNSPGYPRSTFGAAAQSEERSYAVEDDDAQFILDAPEYSDEEWEERPKCNWSYPSFRFAEYQLPGFTCLNEPRWRFMTTFSNASKTDTIYCHVHGIFFHEGVYNWSLIDHNTKADTMVIDMTTE